MNTAGVLSPIHLNSAATISAFVGTMGSDALLAQINSRLSNSNFFGSIDDIIAKGRQVFIERNTLPIRQSYNTIKNAVGMFIREDEYRPIISEEDLKAIPACMHDAIMRYAPVKKLFDQSRIFGFGWDYVPEEDCYGRLLKNGYVADVQEAMDDEGYVEFVYEFRSDDPDLSYEELDMIEETRNYIDWIMENTNYDPTDYPNDRS